MESLAMSVMRSTATDLGDGRNDVRCQEQTWARACKLLIAHTAYDKRCANNSGNEKPRVLHPGLTR